MSRQDLEIGLRKLGEEEIFWRPSDVSPAQSATEADVPRSVAVGIQEMPSVGEYPSVLPKPGSEVLPSSGRIHPILIPLLERTPSSSGLPIVEPPPEATPSARKMAQGPTTLPPSTPEMRSIAEESPVITPHEPGVKSPFPSPLQMPTMAPGPEVPLLPKPSAPVISEVHESHIRPATLGRSVLFIYPPLIDEESVIACYRHAAKTIIRATDHITVLWATATEAELQSAGKPVVKKEELDSYTPGEGIFKVMKVSAENFSEVRDIPLPLIFQAIDEVRERSPFIHRLIESTDLKTRRFLIKLQPHAGIHWTLQQELQSPSGKPTYELIVMPCLPPGMGDDPELEKFLLEHATVPVALVRNPAPASRE